MNVSINLKGIALVALIVYLIANAMVFLRHWIVSPELLGWSALIAGVAYAVSLFVTGSFKHSFRKPATTDNEPAA